MDGTLVDNTPAHIRAFSIFCDRYGVTDWAEKLSGVYGMGNDVLPCFLGGLLWFLL